MAKIDLVALGSQTAKNGFKNEAAVAQKFIDWKKDVDSQKWLIIMGYNLKEIEKVEAIILHGYKTDVQVQITIYLKKAISAENLSVKLVSNPFGFNQVDKRLVDKYVEMWNIPEKTKETLKLFTGELRPRSNNLRDARRTFLNEMNEERRSDLINFFKAKKILVVSDILKGRGKFSAGWMLVVLKKPVKGKVWVLKSINEALNIYGNGEVFITNLGSLRIGKITMQRKGGDGGRETANMLQFKINPVELFDDLYADRQSVKN